MRETKSRGTTVRLTREQMDPLIEWAFADILSGRHLSKERQGEIADGKSVALNLWVHYLLCPQCGFKHPRRVDLLGVRPAAKAMTAKSKKIGGKADLTLAPDWQIRVPSGLSFKFSDPESILGWEKKLVIYRALQVSRDGKIWVDFVEFEKKCQEVNDPDAAFATSKIVEPFPV